MGHELSEGVRGFRLADSSGIAGVWGGRRYHEAQLLEHSAESHTEPGGKSTGWGGEGSGYHPHSIYRRSVFWVSWETSLGPCPPFSTMLRTLGADF